MAFIHSPKIVTDGLTVSLDAGNINSYKGSGSTMTNLVGTPNATLFGSPSFTNDKKGGIICTSTCTISVDTTIGSNYFTTCLFFKYNSNGPSAESILFNKENCWEMRDDGGALNWAVWTSNQSWFWHDSGGRITAGAYNFVALSYGGSSVKTYLNGSLIETYTYPAGGVLANQSAAYPKFNSRDTNFGVGSYPGNNTLYYWMIYNRALTDNEVSQNYKSLKSRFGL